MTTDNLVKLKTWMVNIDKYGSYFKKLDSNIIAVKLKKIRQKNERKITYSSVKLYLDSAFEEKYFKIPNCKEFKITYKTDKGNPINFCIEEDMNIYNYYYILPPSKVWITKKIKISDLKYSNKINTKLNLNKITSLIFSFDYYNKKEIIDTLYIKKFIIIGYQTVSIENAKNLIFTKYFIKKNTLSYINLFIKLLVLKNKNKISDSNGNPLFCIFPFQDFVIYKNYPSLCCWIHIKDNIDLVNNKNLLKLWWGEKFNKIREGIKNSTYSECSLKECMETNAVRANFKNLETIKKEHPDIADYLESKIEKFKGMPKHITLAFASTCNLTCKSCGLINRIKPIKNIYQEYIRQIEETGKNVEKLSIAGLGDPFGSPSYQNWLYNFPCNKFPKLKIINLLTNGILWTEENWNKIPSGFKKYYIIGIISIDGATKETYEYNRGNAKFKELLKNLIFIAKLRKKNEVNFLALTFVVQKNNYNEIPLIIDFAKKYSFDKIIFYQIKNWGSYNPEEFKDVNIFNKNHVEHLNFKKIYKKMKSSMPNDIEVELCFKL